MNEKTEITFMQTRLIRLASEENEVMMYAKDYAGFN